MTHRERILAALSHHEPDRVPIDLGGTESSGLTAAAYTALKRHLGLPIGCRILDPYQHVVFVEDEVRHRFDIATYPLIFEPRHWREARLPEGSPCQVPERWRTRVCPDGSEEVLDENGAVVGRRAASGHHFDTVNPPLARLSSISEIEKHREIIRRFDYPSFTDEPIEQLIARARRMRTDSDRAAILNFQGHIIAAGQLLCGFENFMSDLMLAPAFTDALLTELVDGYCERVNLLFPALHGLVDVILVNDDLGTQAGPMISLDLYRRRIKPFQARLFSYLKAISGLPLLFHSCGSVRWAIPDLIEVGVDALNPVQVSAAEMATVALKRDFGRDITFWGGGCDTQRVLNRGTPAEVREEVRQRIGDLAPGGGFVFCQVHNIQPEVTPENIVAMLEAASEFGGY